MKVLDPQSALLTNAEVHQFLKENKVRPADKPIGSYEQVNLNDYRNARQDFERYIKLTAPHIAAYPPPETYMNNVIKRLRQYNLTETEALMIINLGIGIDRSQLPKSNSTADMSTTLSQPNGDDKGKSTQSEDDNTQALTSLTPNATDAANVETSETYHHYILSRVVENIEERFQGEEGEEKIEQILAVLRDCIPSANGRGEHKVVEEHA